MALHPHPIVILGMYRSGTSSVAAALNRLGVYFGEDADLFPTDQFNESGYWELKEIIQLNRKFIMAFNMRHSRIGPLPTDWLERPRTGSYLKKIEKLFQEKFDSRGVWGWKEPLTSALVPVYEQVCRALSLEPHYLVCVRHPLDVANSRRDDEPFPLLVGLGLWLHYTLSALKDTIGKSRSVVMYGDYLKNPRLKLEPFVNLVSHLHPTEQAWQDVAAMIDPNRSHGRATLEDLDAYPSILRRTYELCAEIASDTSGLVAGRYDGQIDAHWQEYAQLKGMMRDTETAVGNLVLTWQAGDKYGHSNTYYLSEGGWQTVTVSASAPPRSAIVATFYHMPCLVWIRKANWRTGSKTVPAVFKAGATGDLENIDGLTRLAAFGVRQLYLQAPEAQGPFELEIELMLEANYNAAAEVSLLQVKRINAARGRFS